MLRAASPSREIAAALYVSHNTVKTHLRGIYHKLAASTRSEAVTRARELDLVQRSSHHASERLPVA